MSRYPETVTPDFARAVLETAETLNRIAPIDVETMRKVVTPYTESRLSRCVQTLRYWQMACFNRRSKVWIFTAREDWREEISRRTIREGGLSEVPKNVRERDRRACSKSILNLLLQVGEATLELILYEIKSPYVHEQLKKLVDKRILIAEERHGKLRYRVNDHRVIDDITACMAAWGFRDREKNR